MRWQYWAAVLRLLVLVTQIQRDRDTPGASRPAVAAGEGAG